MRNSSALFLCVLMNYIQRYTHFIIQHCFLICQKYRLKMTVWQVAIWLEFVTKYVNLGVKGWCIIYMIVWYWNYGRYFRVKECLLLIEWSIGLLGRISGIRPLSIIWFLWWKSQPFTPKWAGPVYKRRCTLISGIVVYGPLPESLDSLT